MRTLEQQVIFVHDMAGYTKATATTPPLALADFLSAYYASCAQRIGPSGRIVKFLGDACLAIFPPAAVVAAVEAAIALRDDVAPLATAHGIAVAAGSANVHVAEIAVGELGAPGEPRFDVIGQGVNDTFLLSRGRGAGLHLSSALAAILPPDRRTAWDAHVVR